MSCLCGDYCCPSCGTAQGNWRCELCGAWASDACQHISKRTGQYKRQYLRAVDVVRTDIIEAEKEWDAKLEEGGRQWMDSLKNSQ